MTTISNPTITIRRLEDSDLTAFVDVRNSCYPENLDSVEDWQHWRANMPDYCIWNALIAEEDGQVVGSAFYSHTPGMFHPRKFYMGIFVPPAQRERGIGSKLYARLHEELAANDPLALRLEIREDMLESLRFAHKRGFVEEMRSWESVLDVQNFDPTPFLEKAAQVEASGFTCVSLAEYMQREPDYQRKLHAALNEMLADVPRPDTYTPRPFEEWAKAYFEDKSLLPEGYFLALDNDEIAAVSQLWRSPKPEVLYTGLTATMRDYRRKGLALALKLRAIAYAKAQGAVEVRTGNESNNRAMLSINEALGFVKRPIWISLAWNKAEG